MERNHLAVQRTYKIGGKNGDKILWFGKDQVVGWKQTIPRQNDLIEGPSEFGRSAIFEFIDIQPVDNQTNMFFGKVKLIKFVSFGCYPTRM